MQINAGVDQEKPAALQINAATEQEKPAALQIIAGTEQKKPAALQINAATEQEKPAALQTNAATEQKKPAALQIIVGTGQKNPLRCRSTLQPSRKKLPSCKVRPVGQEQANGLRGREKPRHGVSGPDPVLWLSLARSPRQWDSGVSMGDAGEDMDPIYQWMVKQGRLGISSEAMHVVVEIDTEGARACVLTPQDAVEVGGILTELARPIWERSDRSAPFTSSLTALSESAYRWHSSEGELTVFALADTGELAVAYSGAGPCRLDVRTVVEVVQILQRLAALAAAGNTAGTAPAARAGNTAAAAAPVPRPWWKLW